MRRGEVLPLERVGRALENFFKQGNLIALREMALRQLPTLWIEPESAPADLNSLIRLLRSQKRIRSMYQLKSWPLNTS